tara:strand:- start:152 stop:550 length:399 start_codon:yes stop_codon:yes gene_type:complete
MEIVGITEDEMVALMGISMIVGGFLVIFATRLFEFVHLHKMFASIVASILMVTVSIIESTEFLRELKIKAMREADYTESQISSFAELWDEEIRLWKDLTITRMFNLLPSRFVTYLPFRDWDSAIDFLKRSTK